MKQIGQRVFIKKKQKSQILNLKEILKAQPHLVNEKDARGSTPLLLAAYYGFTEISEIILQYPQDIDTQDASGNTALMGICFKGYCELAKLLIELGANVNITNFNGRAQYTSIYFPYGHLLS